MIYENFREVTMYPGPAGFAEALANQYLAYEIGEIAENELYTTAWHEGHANGLREVELYYQDFAVIINAIVGLPLRK